MKSRSDWVSISDLKCFSRVGRMFCLLTAYFDESYNDRTLCVGGWLCDDDTWKHIDLKWAARIEYERRISALKGLKPLTRYHASDCANHKREFEGWSRDRQILLTKKLLSILGVFKPFGVAAGVSFNELKSAFPNLKTKKDIEWEAYKLCMQSCFVQIGDTMAHEIPYERVTIIHDQGKGTFNGAALSAFEDMDAAKKFPNKKYFVTIAPGSAEKFIALQSADLIAYEGMKLTDAHKRGKLDFRKSMEAIIGHRIPITAGYLRADGLHELAELGLILPGARPVSSSKKRTP